ncbi:MAG: hypothetical protein ACFFG0_12245 [Candidatus Thorarchaeota archaeon]
MAKGVYIDRYGNSHYAGEAIASGVYGNLVVKHVIKCGRCGCEIVTKYPTPLSDDHRCDICKKLEPIDKKLDEIIKLLKKE